MASGIYIFILTNPHKKDERFYSNGVYLDLGYLSADTRDFARVAIKGLRKIFIGGLSYKKAGVVLSHILPSSSQQYSLFRGVEESKKSEEFMSVIDRINHRWGKSTIRLASAGLRQEWSMKCNLLSPRYTTSWDELLVVK